MKKFMDKDFLLSTESAKNLYFNHSEKMPIIDYHCHISPMEIAQNKEFENITEIWLGGDHYKWRLMRGNGVEEKYITGDAPAREKFQKWAETLEKAIGNPLYHWSHLELQRYFGFDGYLTAENSEEVWNLCNEKLKNLKARDLIKMSNVRAICTTDDPIDDLNWHRDIKADKSFDIKVLPAWRPEKAMGIEKPDYLDYIKKLEDVSETKITSFETLMKALIIRLDFFAKNDCTVSDHSLDYVMYSPCSLEEVEGIFAKKLSGNSVTREEELKFKTMFMIEMATEYNKKNWVMQLHYSVKRNNNTVMFGKIGADTGFDGMSTGAPSATMADFLNHMVSNGGVPKTILYSLNPNDNQSITSLIGAFQDSTAVGKIQHGSAWWFNDHKQGMTEQMINVANMGLLSTFVGMLTDSRSFLSYTRHEYFRRILCDIIGTWVENGEFPNDDRILGKIIEDISFNNTNEYFGFECKI